jgi:hypothetical protein
MTRPESNMETWLLLLVRLGFAIREIHGVEGERHGIIDDFP